MSQVMREKLNLSFLFQKSKRGCDINMSQPLFHKLNGVTEVASSEISRKLQKFEKQFS